VPKLKDMSREELEARLASNESQLNLGLVSAADEGLIINETRAIRALLAKAPAASK
jgi:hypothetical protein